MRALIRTVVIETPPTEVELREHEYVDSITPLKGGGYIVYLVQIQP